MWVVSWIQSTPLHEGIRTCSNNHLNIENINYNYLCINNIYNNHNYNHNNYHHNNHYYNISGPCLLQ